MKVLIVDNNRDRDCWGANDICLATRREGITLYVRRAPEQDLPSPDAYDRIILSGSLTRAADQNPWTHGLETFIGRTLDLRIPLLGLCFGHQILARRLGGQKSVGTSHAPEYGWTEITKVKPSPLTEGLPQRFYAFSNHADEVTHLPDGTESILRSELCAIQGFQVKNIPAWGVQFHPEKQFNEAIKLLKLWKNQKNRRKLLLHPDGTETFYDENVMITIFGNFLRL